MSANEQQRRSRFILRAMEWDEPRAPYPNLWHGGMPLHVLGMEKIAHRLRLGDLIAIYHPESQRHPERSEKFLGLSRVVGLRRSHEPGSDWIDLETAHRFATPRELGEPRRVFQCCDPGWTPDEVALFRAVFEAAVAEGWSPRPDEGEAPPVAPPLRSTRSGPSFAGVHYGGDMRDPREGTWLAIVELVGGRLRVARLEATGRHGLQGYLSNPGRALNGVEAVGLDFALGLPLDFARFLAGEGCVAEGWWAVVQQLGRMSRPEFLRRVHEFREAHGEPLRWTDERAGAWSPLRRDAPDRSPAVYHGLKMIAEERSRYAVRPFESARGKPLLEVFPAGALARLVGEAARRLTAEGLLDALAGASRLATDVPEPHRRAAAQAAAREALLAARCAALAVLDGEAERSPEELAPGAAERVRLEGWIYGLPPA